MIYNRTTNDKFNSIKILFLSNHFITLYAFRKELIIRLIEAGNEVFISTPADSSNQCFIDMGARVISTPIDRRGVNPIKDIKTIIAYRKIMKDVNPDIIFSYTIKPNIYGALVSYSLGYRQVCNVTGTGATFLNNNCVSKIVRFLYKISVKNSYKVFFQNTGDKDYFLKHHMIADNWDMLPGSGVNLKQYQVTEFPSDDNISFIFIGRVMKLKGIEEYLEAAKFIKIHYSNTRFFIAGWNEEKKYIELVKKYVDSGYVNYIGFKKDITPWIQRCQCTILPSHGGEGIPNVLLESAACGRVCIASDINGTRDVIEEGVTGYLFEVGNTKSLTTKIEKFLSLHYIEKVNMGLAGRLRMEQKFNRNIVINAYLNEVGKIGE